MQKKRWRKLQKSATLSRKVAQQPWPTLHLTRKQKKVFGRSTKVYASELHRTVKKAALFQSYHPVWGHSKVETPWLSTRERSSLLAKRLWFLENPAAVPGVAPMKKRTGLYATKLRAWRSFRFWLCLQKTTARQRLCYAKTSNSVVGWWSYVQLLETTGLSLIQKVGWTSTPKMAHSWASRQWLFLNGAPYASSRIYSRPGDFLSCSWKAQQRWRSALMNLQSSMSKGFLGKKAAYYFPRKAKAVLLSKKAAS